jgi:hypothetical protein
MHLVHRKVAIAHLKDSASTMSHDRTDEEHYKNANKLYLCVIPKEIVHYLRHRSDVQLI